MCQQVFIRDAGPNGGGSLDSVADLRAYGLEVIDGVDWEPEPIVAAGVEFAPETACLCGVDIEAVLRRAGKDFWRQAMGYSLFEDDGWTDGPNLLTSCSSCLHPEHTGVCGAPHPDAPGILGGCPCTA